ncbi:hypothetical protein [Sphingobium sp.]|uniref:hypothetical protein n=1 Tax=Sphingobium sp. TaxID=1912891 RepID=UPI003B3BA91A
MAVDLPPVPNCIVQVTELKSQSLIIEGKADVVRTWLGGPAIKGKPFDVSLSEVDDNGNQTAIQRFSAETPYRDIGGVIFSAQAAKMTVGAWTFQPPLCGAGESPK